MNLTISVPEKYRKEVDAAKPKLNLSKLFLSAFLEWKYNGRYPAASRNPDAEKMTTALRRIKKIATTAEKKYGKEKAKEA